MPRRISPKHPRLVEVVLLVMLFGVMFLSGVVVWALLVGDPYEDEIRSNVGSLLVETRQSQLVNSCLGYQNHRAIEEAFRDVSRMNGFIVGDPRVMPSSETVSACKEAGMPIGVDGLPAIELSDVDVSR